jgi:hypothetical protein
VHKNRQCHNGGGRERPRGRFFADRGLNNSNRYRASIFFIPGLDTSLFASCSQFANRSDCEEP